MSFEQTLRTEDEKVRFVVSERKDGLFSIEKERHQAGDEYTGPYWSPIHMGIFGSLDDVENFLVTVAPTPKDNLRKLN